MKICIDAGHGKYTPGKRCLASIDSSETREWVLNSRIANYVCNHLIENGQEVLRADDITGEVDVSLSQRTTKSNNWGAEILVSIHHDAGAGGTSAGGATVFTYNGNHSVVSDILQKNVYNHFVNEVGKFGNRSNPLQSKNLHMVRESNCPAILIECGFMDSIVDTPMILTENFAKKAALGIAKGILDTIGVEFQEKGEDEDMDINKEVFELEGTGDNPSSWAKDATEWAKTSGIFNGDGKGNYGWGKAITREQLAAILYSQRNK